MDKDKYTDKQKRKAEHIEQSYEDKRVQRRSRSPRLGHGQQAVRGGERKGGSGQKKSPAAKAEARASSARRAVATKHGVPRPGQRLEDMTKAELMDRARKRHIAGRSTMRKEN
ncbi:ParE toxin protein [Pseudomonas putida]|nr:ParE toxin protein [Pseudomonas putida]